MFLARVESSGEIPEGFKKLVKEHCELKRSICDQRSRSAIAKVTIKRRGQVVRVLSL
jgi:hypothetical protein